MRLISNNPLGISHTYIKLASIDSVNDVAKAHRRPNMEFTRTNNKNSKVSRLTNKMPTSTNQQQQPMQKVPGKKPGGSLIKLNDPICTVTVTCGALNVRSEASQSAPRIGGVTEGKTLNVYEVNGDWLKIGYGTGYGWVLQKYTDYKPSTTTTEPAKPEEPPAMPVKPASANEMPAVSKRDAKIE